MAPKVWRTAYISRCVQDFDDRELRALARTSAELNAQSGVTGLLLFDGAAFVQALEGRELAVRATLERIQADERHDDLVVVANSSIEHRAFGGWSMKMFRLDDRLSFERTMVELEEKLASLEDTELRAIFSSFGGVSRYRLVNQDEAPARRATEARALHLHLKLLIEQAQEARRGPYGLQ